MDNLDLVLIFAAILAALVLAVEIHFRAAYLRRLAEVELEVAKLTGRAEFWDRAATHVKLSKLGSG